MKNAPFNKKLLDEVCSGRKPKIKKHGNKLHIAVPEIVRMNATLLSENERYSKSKV